MPRVVAVAVAGAAGLAFALLSAWIAERGSAVPWVDESIHRWALDSRGPVTVRIANDLRWAGVTAVVLPILVPVGAAAAPPGSRWTLRLRYGLLLGAVAGAGVLAEIGINHAIGRARPPASSWAGLASGGSYPSGHATNVTLFALGCAWACASRVRPGWPRRAAWAGAAVYAGAVGWSRVWLGVHWPTDVAGGWLFGLTWMAGAAALAGGQTRRQRASHRP
ncbi:MAG TPA: phosphatase PAP2 family protein [Streptosporangiaceae bacterium]|nr:phosphatase PAP2 family protein [Streptosporangiaceae bacterium]